MSHLKAFIKKNYYSICLFLIFCIALFLRTFRISSLPQSLWVDEAGMGCNSWCLAHYGVDRYLNEMPIYPQNYSGGQSPLYTYLLALVIKTIGRGELSVLICRIPGIIFSMLTVIMGTKLIHLVFQNRKVALMGALLLTVCPYFIMHGRYALDCNLMLGCCMTSMYFLVRYITSPKMRNAVLCGISFGIILYSYAVSYIFVAAFCILATIYLLYTKRITLSHTILWAASLIITALPIVLFIISLAFDLSPYKFLCFTIAPIASGRMSDLLPGGILEIIKKVFTVTLTNGDMLVDAIPKYYTMYFISIPFILIGLVISLFGFVNSVRRRTFRYDALFLLYFFSGLITCCIVGTPNAAYRNISFFVCYLFFLVNGIYHVYHFLTHYRKLFMGILSVCYLIWTASFVRYYFTEYTIMPYPNAFYWLPPYEALEYVQENLEPERLYVDCITFWENYFFCVPQSPYEVAETKHEEGYGKYYFEINYYTPLESTYVYVVRTENSDFWKALQESGLSYNKVEYPHWCVVFFSP
ncbi:MAG: ArnT family glycosyltransferase [Acetatifactor sp.]